jgi:hypothetical protein
MNVKHLGVILFLLVVHCSVSVLGQTCPTTPLSQQQRGPVKKKKPASDISITNIEVSDVFDWELPANIESTKVRNSKRTIDPRETHAFRLTGDLWRVKFEMNDCDLHLEMTRPGGDSNDNRIIVEIPADKFAKSARTAVLEKLTELKKAKQVKKNEMDFKSGVPITITGTAFFDGTHWTKKNPKVGLGHGTKFVKTLWELHPVFSVSFPTG